MKPLGAWWWVLFEHDGRRRILAYVEPSTPVDVVRALGATLANRQPGGSVDLGAWPRRNNRFGHDGLVLRGLEKQGKI